jgi:hypothetical protein
MTPGDIKLESRFSEKSNLRWIALAVAAALLLLVVLTTFTSLPEKILPMTDESMRAMIPFGADGAQPLALKTIDQTVTGTTLRVFGTVENRTLREIKSVMVVIEPTGISKDPGKPVEAPVDPTDIPEQETAKFEVVAEMDETPGNYKVRFRVLDGPYLPHKDERPPAPVPDLK